MSVVYVFALRRVLPVAKIRVWEDVFPGLRGSSYTWFPDGVGDSGGAANNGADADTTPTDPAAHHRDRSVHAPDADVYPQHQQQQSQPRPSSPATVEMPGGPDFSFSPPSPATSAAAPRVPHSREQPAPSTSSSTSTQQPARPSAPRRPPEQSRRSSMESDAAAPDPSWVLNRQLPSRSSRNPAPQYSEARSYNRKSNPDYASASGVASLASAAAFFTLMTAGLTGGVAIDDLVSAHNPAFAFSSATHSVDAAFANWSQTSPDEMALVHATEIAAYIFGANVVNTTDLGDIPIPRGYFKAINGPHGDYWKDAISKEYAGLIALDTWEYVRLESLPRTANLMHCHLILTVKRKRDGSVEKFKARLVADGNTQKYKVDFDRIFSTVVKTATIRLVLIVAAARDYNLTQIDIRQAYLQAEIVEDLYMRVPPGIHPFDDQGRPVVCKLKRSLYGLKQAGREWSILFSAFLVEWGFTRSSIDVCLYTYTAGEQLLWVLVYVDDALCVDNDSSLRERFVTDLSRRFPVDDRGILAWMLGIAVDRDRANLTLSLSQALYVTDLIDRYGSHIRAGHTRRFDMPIQEGLVLSGTDCPAHGSAEYESMAPYRPAYMAIVGSILWLANMTYPELSFPASQLARFISNPGKPHFDASIRVLIYLDGVRDRKLVYRPNLELGFHVLVDSSWGTKFSCSGAFFFYMGCHFHWFAKMQKSVTLSSAEAEYFGAMLAAKDTVFIRDILVDLGLLKTGPTVIFADSKSAVDMAFDPVAFKNTKHILRAAEFLRDLVAREVVTLEHLRGEIMVADILTKSVARPVFLKLMAMLESYSTSSSSVAST